MRSGLEKTRLLILRKRWLNLHAFYDEFRGKESAMILRRNISITGSLGRWPNFSADRSAVEKQKKFLGGTSESLFFNNCWNKKLLRSVVRRLSRAGMAALSLYCACPA